MSGTGGVPRDPERRVSPAGAIARGAPHATRGGLRRVRNHTENRREVGTSLCARVGEVVLSSPTADRPTDIKRTTSTHAPPPARARGDRLELPRAREGERVAQNARMFSQVDSAFYPGSGTNRYSRELSTADFSTSSSLGTEAPKQKESERQGPGVSSFRTTTMRSSTGPMRGQARHDAGGEAFGPGLPEARVAVRRRRGTERSSQGVSSSPGSLCRVQCFLFLSSGDVVEHTTAGHSRGRGQCKPRPGLPTPKTPGGGRAKTVE